MARRKQRRVAITGAGIVSPLGRGLRTFGDNLLAGVLGIRQLEDAFGPDYESIPVRFGGVVDNSTVRPPGALENASLVPRAIAFAADALNQINETSGADLTPAPLHCGVGTGQVFPELDDLRKYGARALLAEIEALLRSVGREPTLQLSSIIHGDASTTLLKRTFGLRGTGATYNGACSASTQACIAACEDVAAGADIALGGGHDSMLQAAGLNLMYALGALTEESTIRPFDVNRDGTLIGEGAVYFLFEELDHATARGADILAEVVGWSSSMDGYHLTSPDPTGSAAIRMIGDALAFAGVQAHQIDYVNAHGTSTLANDLVESLIINTALEGRRCYVSSTKAQVGHLIAACGAIGLAASISGLKHQLVPPNPNLAHPDPECDVKLAPRQAIPASLRHVLCNSFGFAGQNSCMILKHPGVLKEREP